MPTNHGYKMKMILLALVLMIIPAQAEVLSVGRQFQVSAKASPDELAHIVFQAMDRQTGWNRLYIYTNPAASPIDQHRAAGFLEGYATYSQIHSAFLNFAGLDFKGESYAPADVQAFLDQQLGFMDGMVSFNPDEPFWTYVGYYLEQVRFMHAGYLARVRREKRSDLQLDFKQFYYLTSIGDLQDLLPAAGGKGMEERKNCNAYVRLDQGQLFITHGTHNRFSFLLRIFKTWNFPRAGVPLQSTSFTSRPGDLISKDDFFLLSSGLRVLETSLTNKVQANLQEVKTTTVPSWLRTLVANHLAQSIPEWISLFSTFRSGTHNNQWVLIDPRQLPTNKGIVTFFEEAFSLSRIIDMTPQLLANGYVAGYNTPITPEIYQKLGYKVEDGTYLNESRAIVFKKYHPKMKTVQDMKYWLIANEQENIYQGLAPRYDLLPQYASPFGMTDCKIASPDSLGDGFFWAISGPPTSHGRFPPFDWKKWEAYPHDGLQQSYDFAWQKIPLQVE